MTPIEKLRADRAYVLGEMRSISEGAETRALDADEQTRFDEGAAFVAECDKLIERHNTVARLATEPEHVEAGATFGAPHVIVRSDPFDLSDLNVTSSPQEFRSKALGAIEATGDAIDDVEQGQAEKVVRSLGSDVAQRVVLTGSPQYREAFAIAATRGLGACTDPQRQALERAASLTSGAGGYAVPFTLDPTVIQTQARSTNPFRQISTVKQINTNVWHGVSSAGVTASWDAEAAEVSDDTPTLTQPTITCYKGQVFVPFSVEIGGDWAGIEAELRSEFMVAKDNLEGNAFAVGTGSSQPVGITKALDGGSSEIAPTTAETFALADVYKVESALEARYRANASWIANKVVYNAVRQFDTGGGNGLWERLGAGQPAQLLGYNAYECSDMDGVLPDAAATADNFLMVLGDFRNYVIVDRVGMSVELVPHLFHTSNNLPKGQRGLLAWWRVGADSVNDAAFAMLSIPTTA